MKPKTLDKVKDKIANFLKTHIMIKLQGEIIVFDPVAGTVKASHKANTDNQTLACSPDGRTLLAGDASGAIRIFDFQSLNGKDSKLKLLHIITSVEAPIKALAFLDDKRFVDLREREIILIALWEAISKEVAKRKL